MSTPAPVPDSQATEGLREHYILGEHTNPHGPWPNIQRMLHGIAFEEADPHAMQRPGLPGAQDAQPPSPPPLSETTDSALASLLNAQMDQVDAINDLRRVVLALLDWAREQRRMPIWRAVYLDTTRPLQIKERKHKHAYLLLATATQLTIVIPGLGTGGFTQAFGTGYNRLDFPDSTEVFLTTAQATPFPAVLYLTDDPISVPD